MATVTPARIDEGDRLCIAGSKFAREVASSPPTTVVTPPPPQITPMTISRNAPARTNSTVNAIPVHKANPQAKYFITASTLKSNLCHPQCTTYITPNAWKNVAHSIIMSCNFQ
eukprot:CCRYP_009079-RB/>CCRYP_009079-RB protein AED:0.21 eAED:0.25 QI:0/0.5/0.66/1/0/0/3/1781/112